MIEIKGFIEESFLDWDGKISAVIFLSGCNFRCPFCQNGLLLKDDSLLETISFEYIANSLRENKIWIDGVVISGGEPCIWSELPAFIRPFKEMGFSVKLDTNGTNPHLLKTLIEDELIDYVAMDIKAPIDEEEYSQIVGTKVDIEAIKDSIRILLNANTFSYEFRTTVVPTLLDSEKIMAIARYIKGAKRYLLQQFVPEYALSTTFRQIESYSKSQLMEIVLQVKRIIPNTSYRGR